MTKTNEAAGAVAPAWNAMAFFHAKGHVPAYDLAKKFVGDGGRVATLIDVLEARIDNENGGPAWNNYFTTASAEYFGLDANGKKMLAVMHGVGPLATSKGIVAAYARKGEHNRRLPGFVTQEMFESILAGREGPVSVVEMPDDGEAVYKMFRRLTAAEAMHDPIAVARMGSKLLEYFVSHEKAARTLFKICDDRAPDTDAFMLDLRPGDNDASYWRTPEKGTAQAHLISVSGLNRCSSPEHGIRAMVDITLHDWSDGTRYMGIRPGAGPIRVHRGPKYDRMLELEETRRMLLVPRDGAPIDMRSIVRIDDGNGDPVYAAREALVGAGLDGYPDVPVLSLEEIGEPRTMSIEPYGHHAFFNYALKDVEPLAPEGANGYFRSEPGLSGNRQVCDLQFVKAVYDQDHRYLREDELMRDFPKLMDVITTMDSRS